MVDLRCTACDIIFQRSIKNYNQTIRRGQKPFCSRKCVIDHKHKHPNAATITITCALCGDVFIKLLRYNRGIKQRFCSSQCFTKYRHDELTAFRLYMRNIDRRCEKSGWVTDVDLKYLKELWDQQNGTCPLTGWKMVLHQSQNTREHVGNPRLASVDRIDSNIPYVRGNIRFVAYMANISKHTFTDEQLVEFCEAVSQKLGHAADRPC